MDRFIEALAAALKAQELNLKSSMDRFIVKAQISERRNPPI